MATSTSVRNNLRIFLPHPRRVFGARTILCLVILLSAAGGLLLRQRAVSATPVGPPDKLDAVRLQTAFGQLPLRFEANDGRLDERVQFLARGAQATLFLTAREAVLRLRGTERADVLRLGLVNANRAPLVTGLEQLPSSSHYFIGRDASRWRTGVAHFGKVRYASVYPGIDLIFYGQAQLLEYDFVVAPGADARRIRMNFAGARAARVNEQGELVLQLASGEVRQRPPVAYQEIDGERRVIPARYRLYGKNQVGFTLGAYDRRQTLWIDPVLEYSTYLGGDRSDQGLAVAVDGGGATYVAGLSDSLDFPAPGPLQAVHGASLDAFIAKLNARGTALIYAAYLGGNSTDIANSVALDTTGNVYLGGTTFSTDFPVTTNAVQRTAAGNQDSFVAKIAPSGTALVYSTLLGGVNTDTLSGLTADAAGGAYFIGRTDSPGFAGLTNARRGAPALKSADRAQTWTGASNGLTASAVNGLATAPTNQNTLYAATNYGIFKSNDGGAIWRSTGAQVFANTVAVDPTTPTTIYVGGSFSVLKSVNGGDSFETVFFDSAFGFPNILSLLIDPTDPNTLYAGTSRGAFKSANGGANWAPIINGMAQTPGSAPRVNRLVFDPSNPMTLYAAASNTLFKTTNGGALWTPANSGLGTSTFLEILTLAVDPLMPNTLYAGVGSFAGALYKSVDGGASWRQSSNGISYQFGGNTFLLSVNNLAVDPTTPATLYATTTSGGIFKSTDGGGQWNIMRGAGLTNRLLTALAVDSAGLLYAGANVGGDAFLGKLNADGSALSYFRYYGGSENDEGRAIAVDASGAAYVIGATSSIDLPTANPLQPKNRGFSDDLISSDAFVVKLDPAGTEFVYATYLGGNSTDQGRAIAVDAAGAAYVAGNAASTDFPVVNAFKPGKSDFGFDLFVARINAAGAALDYSTYLGGSSEDLAAALAVDAAGNAYVTGTTTSPDFPAVNTLQAPNALSFSTRDLFISKLSPQGGLLTFSTFLGGSRDELAGGIVVDAARNVYLTGATNSTDFPTLNPMRPATGPSIEAFLVKLAPRADLAITGAALPDPVQASNRVTYTLTVTNRGPDEAGEVTLTDTLPTGLTNVTVTASVGACGGAASITCNLGELAAGAGATVTITATAPATGPLRNAASVTSNTPDTVTANNSITQETRISTLPSISGRVSFGGVGLPGVTVSLSGGQTAARQTDSNGAYQFAELPAGGAYTVSASRPGYVLRPSRQDFSDLRADQTADFNATACNFAIAPVQQSFPAIGGTGTVMLMAPDGACPWMARSNAAWITITGGANGQGNGAVSYSVAPTAAPRSGTIIIGDRTFTVQQEFEPCATPSFRVARGFPLASFPNDLAAGDFNGDGRLDLVVLNNSSAMVSVLAGDGMGGFDAPADVVLGGTTPITPRAVAVGDFNGDNRSDLAFTSGDTNGVVSILLSSSAGGFTSPRNFSVGQRPGFVAVGEFNGDGRPDLVTLNSGSVSILPGASDGSFGTAINFSDPSRLSSPITAALGDFNGDGNADLVVASGFIVVVLVGDGMGGLRRVGDITSGVSSSRALAAGDFNRDGRLDLAVANSSSFSPSAVRLFQGDGMGGFATPTEFPVGPGAMRIAVSDFNGDGLADVVTANEFSGNVSLLLGTGTGGFPAAMHFAAGEDARALAPGDFNRDGRPDLAVLTASSADFDRPSRVALLAGVAGGFIAARDTLISRRPTALAAGDFNSDGRMDLATAHNDTTPGGIEIRLGNGSGGFGEPITVNTPAPEALAARDFNQDGKLDLITRSGGAARVLLGDGQGGFRAAASLPIGGAPQPFTLADFNRDGRLDLVGLSASGQPALFLGDGAGGFGAPVSFGAGMNLNLFEVGDFNGDGHLDVAATAAATCGGGTASLLIFPGDGMGGFGPGLRRFVNFAPTLLRAGDFDGDGRDDLALVNSCSINSSFALAFSGAGGAFTTGASSPLEGTASAIAAGDLNSDGRDDLLVVTADVFSNFSGSNFYVVLAGAAGAPVNVTSSATAVGTALGDSNGDGRTDLVVASGHSQSGGGTISVLLNGCLRSGALSNLSAASFTGTAFAPESIAAAFGAGLAIAAQAATTQPLPTELQGTTARVIDSSGVTRLAPLFFVSPTQINYLIPAGTASGAAVVRVTSGDGRVSTGAITIAPVAPGLFAANANGQGVMAAVVLRVRADGSQVYEPVSRFDAAQNHFVTMPIDLGPETDQVFLVAFGTGIRFRSALSAVSVRVGGLAAPALFAGAQGTLEGLDQVNARLPRGLAGRGQVDVMLIADGQTANTLQINVR